VLADQTQLHQVLLNLAVNARDAMPNGGVLSLTATNVELSEGDAALPPSAAPGPYVLVQVKDTGIGIPEEIMDRIFDPFFTTKPLGKGTGLGLSSCVGIVKSHGGFLTVSSHVGSGSMFHVYLPAEKAGATLCDPAKRANLPVGSGELVLVVDDEPGVRLLTEKMLRAHGYHTLLASGGHEALNLFAEHWPNIKLVVTDLMMPGMNGHALAAELLKRQPELKIIASSGLIGGEQNSPAADGTFVDLLRKPFDAEQLLGKVQTALSLSS
jgi:CheY-like chemotaxis protein